jgi:hypothetical protein
MHAWVFALVFVTSSSALAQSPRCYSLDRSFSIARGDIVLTTSDGLIKDLLSSIGQYYTHTGMALSGSRVRHNSMDESLVDQIATRGLRQIPDRLKATGERSLRDGGPGMRTDSLNGYGFRASTSLVLTGPREHRTGRGAAASAIEAMDGYYRLYAYTDMRWDDPEERALNAGNMCSGSIAWAAARAGKLPKEARYTYTAEVRNGAAKVLFNSMKKRVRAAIPELIRFVMRDARLTTITENIANQVVNCMAFNDCGNVGPRWRKGVGAGSTISPDNLADLMHAFWFSAALTKRPNPYPYQWVAPVEVQSPVYCCRTDTMTFECK